jgi:hypothetical protein
MSNEHLSSVDLRYEFMARVYYTVQQAIARGGYKTR